MDDSGTNSLAGASMLVKTLALKLLDNRKPMSLGSKVHEISVVCHARFVHTNDMRKTQTKSEAPVRATHVNVAPATVHATHVNVLREEEGEVKFVRIIRGASSPVVSANVWDRRQSSERAIPIRTLSTEAPKEEMISVIFESYAATGFSEINRILKQEGFDRVKVRLAALGFSDFDDQQVTVDPGAKIVKEAFKSLGFDRKQTTKILRECQYKHRLGFQYLPRTEQLKALRKMTRAQLLEMYFAHSEERLNKRYARKMDYTDSARLRDWELPKGFNADPEEAAAELAEKIALAKRKKQERLKRNRGKKKKAPVQTLDWVASLRQQRDYENEGLVRRAKWMAEIEARTQTKQRMHNSSDHA